MRLVTPDQMREMDRRTIDEIGLPGIVLMERAALGAVETLLDHFGEDLEGVGFLCGGGNNGGDGVAMARMLEQRGYRTELVFLSSTDGIDGDAKTNLAVADAVELDYRDLGDLAPEEVAAELAGVPDCEVWVDAMLGTGLTGDVRGRYVPAIEFLNERPHVFAVDIPSGIHGKDGREMGAAVDADATATFGGAKLGQALYPGRGACGRLKVVDIGIPDRVRDEVGTEAEWLDETWASSVLAPRSDVFHKGRAGRMLAVAGSHEKTGAALLTARGALAGGCGLITVGTTEPVVERVAPAIHEVMAAELVDREKSPELRERLEAFAADMDVVAVGPGLETHAGAVDAVRTVLGSEAERLVLDADALNIVARSRDRETLADAAERRPVVATPHPGEMARLRNCTVQDVLEAPVDCAASYAEETGAHVVLKMAATVVAGPDGRLAVNRSGNPGMATGGTGDVLTGIVAARHAESTGDPFVDTCLAVWAHGRAGDLAAEANGARGLRATDIADRLPSVWKQLVA